MVLVLTVLLLSLSAYFASAITLSLRAGKYHAKYYFNHTLTSTHRL